MYIKTISMCPSEYLNYKALYNCFSRIDDKIEGICTNKMHNVESAFVTSSIGYRAKNDPGD